MTPLRHLFFAVLAVLSVLVLPLAVVSAWTESVATDTDQYVQTVAPLAEEPVVQDFVSRQLAAEVVARIPGADPALVARVDGNFARVDATLAKYRQGDGFEPYDKLSGADRNALKRSITALAEDLSTLRGKLGVD